LGTALAIVARRSKIDYMTNYTGKVVSVRIDEPLLEAVRKRAKKDGRSISGEVAALVRAQLAAEPAARTIKPISGWLSDLDVPSDLEEFRAARREASTALLASTRRRR
jgi:hypothetical protein